LVVQVFKGGMTAGYEIPDDLLLVGGHGA
jgi:hypothetical protein